MIDRFMASFEQPPKELILDFDATDDAVHGKQEGYFFHGMQIITAFCRCMYFVKINCW
ncbi:Transposase DDE domain group 1 [Nitrosomonas sp. Nm34]|nr:Transposase DDE domain group 1 [Nitrosomonas sp. Nm34]